MLRAYTSQSVRLAEEPLIAAGAPLMAEASAALAAQILGLMRAHGARSSGTTVLALIGAGNNGGDALYAGALLARRGAAVHAALVTANSHPEGLAAARSAGVTVHHLVVGDDGLDLATLAELARRCGVWVDGITGIGARGALREPLAGAVALLDHEHAASPDAPLVIAVDVPSGVGVDDGSLPGPVLRADLTVAMGAAKPAHLTPPAEALSGRVEVIDLGLLPGLLAGDEPVVARLEPGDVADLWPTPAADGHKYSRGVLHAVAGSRGYPGAAVLVVEGAVRTGVGMVRIDASQEVVAHVLARRPEAVPGEGRAQAHVLGPGIEVDDALARRLTALVLDASRAGEPVVLDASALPLLSRPELADLPASVVLTPHAGELATLLSARGEQVVRAEVEAAPARHARLAAEITGATVLLKGPVTVVAAPDGPLFAQNDGTAWLATAGAGDVLSGIVGALLAGHGDRIAELARAGENIGPLVAPLAAAAALVHGRAARVAAGQFAVAPVGSGEARRASVRAGHGGAANRRGRSCVGGPIAALDVADAIPLVVRALLAGDENIAWRVRGART